MSASASLQRAATNVDMEDGDVEYRRASVQSFDTIYPTPVFCHVTSLSFSSIEGAHAILAIGRADGRITLWSPFDRDPRFDSEQPAPVSCVCFSSKTFKRASIRDTELKVPTEHLLIGDEAGHVYLYSVEWPNEVDRDLFGWHGSMTLLARLTLHTQQICGLAWSPDGDFFATGGNDNMLFLFETRKVLRPLPNSAPTVHVRSGGTTNPLPGQGTVLSIIPGQESQHWTLNAAVKALAFCPWQPSLLAAGGGSNDRAIHFYHALSGATLATIDCAAQVTSLVWSRTRREIAATFGFAQPDHPFRVAVFSWPGCDTLVKIPWFGEERALWAVAYPGGPNTSVDETTTTAAAVGSAGTSDSTTDRSGRAREGTPWYTHRTRDEGCLVIATSDASIKFHEVWSERSGPGGTGLSVGLGGSLGASDILEALHGVEKEGKEIIR
ncbi:hypothetical protein MBLNU459_g7966t1 [Dothideomycetes sp. NU459]